jgi:2-polyprenyl-3-methyl-5-hydroxy-6-metoxy-1,4-benzoquinol methylase
MINNIRRELPKDPRWRLMEDYSKKILEPAHQFDPNEYERTRKRFHMIYSKHLDVPKDAQILDVGCGDGHFLYYLKSLGYKNLTGIDASDDRLKRCREYVTPSVYAADAFVWLNEHIGAFDLVASNHVVEHFNDELLYPFMELLVGAVAPGGRLLITTPNACTPWAGYNLYHDLTHCRLFTSDSLTQLMGMYGVDAKCFPEAAVPYDVPSAVRWLVWKVREAMVKFDFRVQVGGTRGGQRAAFLVSPNIFAIGRKAER